jgi:methyl-accepting chemotaxis protein
MKKFKLSTRLIGGFVAVAIITFVVGIIGYLGAARLGNHLHEVAVVRLPSIQGLELMTEAQTAVKAAERTLLIPGIDQARIKHEHERIRNAWSRAEKGWKIYEPLPQTVEEAAKWKEFVPAWEAWKNDHEKFLALFDESRKTGDKETLAKAMDYSLSVASESFKKAEQLLGEIVQINFDVAEEARKNSNRDEARTKVLSVVCTLVGLVSALAMGIVLAISITKPVKNVADLLSNGADQVAAAAGQVSSSSQSLAEGASEGCVH